MKRLLIALLTFVLILSACNSQKDLPEIDNYDAIVSSVKQTLGGGIVGEIRIELQDDSLQFTILMPLSDEYELNGNPAVTSIAESAMCLFNDAVSRQNGDIAASESTAYYGGVFDYYDASMVIGTYDASFENTEIILSQSISKGKHDRLEF